MLALAWFRWREGTPFRRGFARAALDVSLATFFLGTIFLTLRPDSTPAPPGFHLFSFTGVQRRGSVVDVVGNVVLFIPFGLLVPLRWPSMRSLLKVGGAACAFSSAIETLQLLLGNGRSATVQDVILNTVGSAAGYGLLIAIVGLKRRSPNRGPISRKRLPPRPQNASGDSH